MSEIFNFKRFGTYFLFDLRQMWRKHSKVAIVVGGSVAFLYVIWVLFSMIFTQTWTSPSIEMRFFMFIVALAILELYQARTYGYLTDAREGADWLMVPASRTEKFISMLLMTLVVIPVLFYVVFFSLDGILTLVDPTIHKALISGFGEVYRKMINTMGAAADQSPILFSSGSFVFMYIVSFICNYLYFLLCGVVFKRNKIVWALVIVFVFSTLISILSGLLVPIFVLKFGSSDIDMMRFMHFLVGVLNGSVVLCCLLGLGFGWGIWHRIKTLQH